MDKSKPVLIHPEIHRQLKIRAAQDGVTIGDLIAIAVEKTYGIKPISIEEGDDKTDKK